MYHAGAEWKFDGPASLMRASHKDQGQPVAGSDMIARFLVVALRKYAQSQTTRDLSLFSIAIGGCPALAKVRSVASGTRQS